MPLRSAAWLGAALVRPLHKLRPGALMILVASLLVPLIALLAVPFGPWWMAGLLFIAMLGVPSVRVLRRRADPAAGTARRARPGRRPP